MTPALPSLAGLSKAELAEKLIAVGVEPKKAASGNAAPAQSSRREPPPFEVGRKYVPVVVLNVRSAPGGGASVVTTANPGIALVPSGQRQRDWWEVESEDSTGWVHSGYLQPAP